MQFAPDFTEYKKTAAWIREQYDIAVTGPGWYLTKADSVLILPATTRMEVDASNVWRYDDSPDSEYDARFWNCQFDQTVHSVMAQAPTRLDTR